ncbi:MAG: EmrA/EmrK family multidrug efflux transporter periplasmic adaptor subunit, partial [Legionella sp. 21-45-4]
IGWRINTDTQLLAIIPLNEVWVDANFKESQLSHMRLGQPVIVTSDLYGSRVQYHGKIVGFSAGTGSAFALLPAQNATGNWIKVVQRLPVRIGIDPNELAAYPLRIGLSMQVTVNTYDRSGQLMSSAGETTRNATQIYAAMSDEAEEETIQLINKTISKLESSEYAATRLHA